VTGLSGEMKPFKIEDQETLPNIVGDIVLLNEETCQLSATEARDVSRLFIIMSSARGGSR